MKINRVTITGADGKNTYSELLSLQKQYPFVEWGYPTVNKTINKIHFKTSLRFVGLITCN